MVGLRRAVATDLRHCRHLSNKTRFGTRLILIFCSLPYAVQWIIGSLELQHFGITAYAGASAREDTSTETMIAHSQLAPLPSELPFRIVSKTIGQGAYAWLVGQVILILTHLSKLTVSASRRPRHCTVPNPSSLSNSSTRISPFAMAVSQRSNLI